MNYEKCILRKCDMCKLKNKCFKDYNEKTEKNNKKKLKEINK